MAKVIWLHGASSSGKSTIARALQARIEEAFWHYSIDHLRDAGVLPMARFRSGEFAWKAQRDTFFAGFNGSVVAFLGAGNDLILEHILETPEWRMEWRRLLAPYDVFFVGVHTALKTLRRREEARGDRPRGSAEADFHAIHAGVRYDLEVSGEGEVDETVNAVLTAWRARSGRSQLFED